MLCDANATMSVYKLQQEKLCYLESADEQQSMNVQLLQFCSNFV